MVMLLMQLLINACTALLNVVAAFDWLQTKLVPLHVADG